MITAAAVKEIIATVRPYTMVSDDGLECTIRLTLDAIKAGIPGVLVECGTWLGGSSFAMLLAQRHALGEIKRPVWMYDSFEGMSPPTEPDGRPAAKWWKEAVDLPKDQTDKEYCIAPYWQVVDGAKALGILDHVIIHKGWLADTLPQFKPDQIAVLRIDCDWYEPVKCVLDHLEPHVSIGSPIIIDDYYAWAGAVLATHEYLTEHKLAWPIIAESSGIGMTADEAMRRGAWLIKKAKPMADA